MIGTGGGFPVVCVTAALVSAAAPVRGEARQPTSYESVSFRALAANVIVPQSRSSPSAGASAS